MAVVRDSCRVSAHEPAGGHVEVLVKFVMRPSADMASVGETGVKSSNQVAPCPIWESSSSFAVM